MSAMTDLFVLHWGMLSITIRCCSYSCMACQDEELASHPSIITEMKTTGPITTNPDSQRSSSESRLLDVSMRRRLVQVDLYAV